MAPTAAKREEFLASWITLIWRLTNNLSEKDIREYARMRKIAGHSECMRGGG